MRLIKMLGLTTTTALAAMAVIAASPAMANEEGLLCTNLTHPTPAECIPAEHIHFLSVRTNGEGLHIDARTRLLAGSNTVECNLLVLGDVLEPHLASPIKILATFTHTNCNLGCSVTAPGGGDPHGTIDILKTALDLATVLILEVEKKLTCPFIFTCDYNTPNLTGHAHHLEGAGTAQETVLGHLTFIDASLTLKEKLSGPFNCPVEDTFDALLKSLTPLHIIQ